VRYQYDPKPLAIGGEKVVHLGRCVDTRVDVVIKFLRKPYSPADLSRFKLEVQRMNTAAISAGAGVARVVDHNFEVDPPFYVEEYYPDGTLAKKMKDIFDKRQVFKDGAAVGYCRQVLVTLRGIHDGNQIHRDLKPSNILVRASAKQLVITDMGIGRTRDRSTTLQTRLFKGTRGYAAPEQENNWPVDHRADLYAVGVILHEMLTGKRGSHDSCTYGSHEGVRTLLLRLLAVDRDDRFEDAGAVIVFIDKLRIATR